MHLLGLAETPGEIAGLLDLRRRELGLTCLTVDDISGVQPGYTAKLMAGIKRPGDISLPALLGALGARVVVCADDAWLPAITRRHVGSSDGAGSWKRPPRLLPPPERLFAAVPGLLLEDASPPLLLAYHEPSLP